MKTIFKSMLILLATTLSWGALASSGGGSSDDFRLKDITQFNLNDSVGLKGYDPVSYFQEGGGSPLPGVRDFNVDYRGVTYFFANDKNLVTFLNEAERTKNIPNHNLKYEPTYGGWCAFAMASGGKIDIDPLLYDFTGDRLHFFVAPEARRLWIEDKSRLERNADRRWNRILQRARR